MADASMSCSAVKWKCVNYPAPAHIAQILTIDVAGEIYEDSHGGAGDWWWWSERCGCSDCSFLADSPAFGSGKHDSHTTYD
jgi:hypothetical protein